MCRASARYASRLPSAGSAAVIGGTLQAGDGLSEARWFPYTGEFPAMAFDADRHIIAHYFETDLKGAPVDPGYARAGDSVHD